MVASIRSLTEHDPAVERVGPLLTMHLGPHEVLLNIEIQFRRSLSAAEMEAAIDRVEAAVRGQHPDVKRIFIEAESLAARARETGKTPA